LSFQAIFFAYFLGSRVKSRRFAQIVLSVAVVVTFSIAGVAPAFAATVRTDAGLQNIGDFYGRISWSIDGAAEPSHVAGTTIPLQFEKPVGARVRQAFIISGDGGNRNSSPTGVPTDFRLNGSAVTFTSRSVITTNPGGDSWNNFNTYWGDVTSLVKSTIDSASAGVHDLAFDQGDGTDGDSSEGGSLVVIFDDPNAPLSSIHLNAGTSNPAGDSFSFSFPALTSSNLANDMLLSVGISNSFQNTMPDDGEGGSGYYQSSRISVNSTLFSNFAGGCDDSTTFLTSGCNFGGYNTIGGVGNAAHGPLTRPDPPVPTADQELYLLNSVMAVGQTHIDATTLNPSNDDNVYFAGLYLRGILPTATYCSDHVLECFPDGDPAQWGSSSSPSALASTGGDYRPLIQAGALFLISGAVAIVFANLRRRRQN
jgi:hypothetical protein